MRSPSGRTHLYAILADPVDHVRAPEFFNPRIAGTGLDAFLIPLHVRRGHLAETVPVLARIGNLKGFVVTIPHKEAMARMCAELGPNGRLVGTVNTVRIEPEGRLVGEMFDGIGLVAGMRANGIEPQDRRILMVGTGGAGRAIAFAFADAGAAALTVWNRTRERALALVRDVLAARPAFAIQAGDPDPRGHDIVVNATSLGLHDDDPLPVEVERIESGASVVEIIAVRETPLMRLAHQRGLQVMGGRPMVDHQIDAQLAFLGAPALTDA